jgi:hypothetical protein
MTTPGVLAAALTFAGAVDAEYGVARRKRD